MTRRLHPPRPRSALAIFLCVGVHAHGDETPLTTELVASGLDLVTFVTHAPGDERLFVLERKSGAIVLVKPDGTKSLFMSIFPKLGVSGGEHGLLGMAFHPDYTSNGFFYLYYTDVNLDCVIERYSVSATDPDKGDPASGAVLLVAPKPFIQHNAGMLQFGPDGYLYASVGDGGSGYDPNNNAQDITTLLGSILRIDVDSAFPYAIPPSNPFASVPGARGEIWHYGLRNPWRFSIDPATGDMFIGDVGQEMREELNFAAAGVSGLNFGWRCLEGDICNSWLPECGDCSAPGTTPPFHMYDHLTGCAVTGGVVYRGCAIPDLQGTYFFADFCFGRIWSLRYDGTTVTDFQERTAELAPGGASQITLISSFGVDHRGEILIADHLDGEIYRIVPDLPLGPDCNDNGVPDGCEIADGTVNDANGNLVIDTCEYLLAIDDLQLGKNATFEFVGANAAEPVFFVFSLNGAGNGYCITPSTCLGILDPISVLAVPIADSQGKAAFSVFVPPSTPLIPVAFQSVLYRGPGGVDSVLSNAVDETVAP